MHFTLQNGWVIGVSTEGIELVKNTQNQLINDANNNTSPAVVPKGGANAHNASIMEGKFDPQEIKAGKRRS